MSTQQAPSSSKPVLSKPVLSRQALHGSAHTTYEASFGTESVSLSTLVVRASAGHHQRKKACEAHDSLPFSASVETTPLAGVRVRRRGPPSSFMRSRSLASHRPFPAALPTAMLTRIQCRRRAMGGAHGHECLGGGGNTGHVPSHLMVGIPRTGPSTIVDHGRLCLLSLQTMNAMSQRAHRRGSTDALAALPKSLPTPGFSTSISCIIPRLISLRPEWCDPVHLVKPSSQRALDCHGSCLILAAMNASTRAPMLQKRHPEHHVGRQPRA
ncbi:hypothetical protein SAMD00023353_2601570 [Rosellinia necatrix]|uniref:Uncharacterized protein n=1 Tax=Rosellinia necatrix TaxID=77044 RepID=A0A1S8A992_ROSNE|nr:hypothetical protein SAMD00023353_2601570 [Rosellinia necatrix]